MSALKLPFLLLWYLISRLSVLGAFLPPKQSQQFYYNYNQKSWNKLLAVSNHDNSNQHPRLAIIGDDLLAGAAAAIHAAREYQSSNKGTARAPITFFTSEKKHIQTIRIPDVTLDNRELMERYASGGRELAGILSRFSPREAKEFLTNLDLTVVEDVKISSDETSHCVVQEEEKVREILLKNIQNSGVDVQFQTVKNITTSNGTFLLCLLDHNGKESFSSADSLVIVGDVPEWETEIKTTTTLPSSTFTTTKAAEKLKNNLLIQSLQMEEDPQLQLSRKELFDLEKKKKQWKKTANMDINDPSLSKREVADLKRQTKKAIKKKKKKKPMDEEDSNIDVVMDEDKNTTDTSDVQPATTQYSCFGLAQSLGHSLTTSTSENRIPGLFSFIIKSEIPALLKGCSLQVAPQARLRCKLPERPKERNHVPKKYTGSLIISKNELAGSGSLRLSSLVAKELHDDNYQGSLHIHFAPDIGEVAKLVEELQQACLDEPEVVLSSLCPLEHVEIDYDDYDAETGDFRRIVQPLVPGQLWANICKHIGIGDMPRSKVSDSQLEALARLMVDFPLTITGIRPQQEECINIAGVDGKEIDMKSCQSKLVPGLFLCGNVLSVHGFDGGYNALASIATGHMAGQMASRHLALLVDDSGESTFSED